MKKIWLVVPAVLYPYVLLGMMFCILGNHLPDTILTLPSGIAVILLFLLYGFFAMAMNLLFAALCVRRKWSGSQAAKINMVYKLVQIPAYLLIFVLGLLFLITVFTIPFAVLFLLADGFSIAMSGIVGAAAAFRCSREKPGGGLWLLCGVGQFVFVADVVACIWMYVRARDASRAG